MFSKSDVDRAIALLEYDCAYMARQIEAGAALSPRALQLLNVTTEAEERTLHRLRYVRKLAPDQE